ncbi:Uncharacterised protein [Yersinia kristensenii]|nr:Uncharacterised protein [Yersinia kristensenii]
MSDKHAGIKKNHFVKSVVARDFLKQGIISKLNYGYSVAKRLDEHRELVEALVKEKVFLHEHSFFINHLSTQDDYLMRIFFMVHREWPDTQCHVRERPKLLRECELPEFKKDN